MKPRREKINAVLMLLTLACLLAGLYMQLFRLLEIHSFDKNVRAVEADNRVLRARVENLKNELSMETRPEIVLQRADYELGMIVPDGSESMTVVKIKSQTGRNVVANVP